MAPQYPYHPVYRRQRRHSVVDITITSIVSAVAGIAALGSLWFSLFFAMATDSCGEQCDYAALNAAYLVTWGGVGVAVLLGASGIIVAAVRGWMMWIWPTLALVLIVAALLIGVLLANSVNKNVTTPEGAAAVMASPRPTRYAPRSQAFSPCRGSDPGGVRKQRRHHVPAPIEPAAATARSRVSPDPHRLAGPPTW